MIVCDLRQAVRCTQLRKAHPKQSSWFGPARDALNTFPTSTSTSQLLLSLFFNSDWQALDLSILQVVLPLITTWFIETTCSTSSESSKTISQRALVVKVSIQISCPYSVQTIPCVETITCLSPVRGFCSFQLPFLFSTILFNPLSSPLQALLILTSLAQTWWPQDICCMRYFFIPMFHSIFVIRLENRA